MKPFNNKFAKGICFLLMLAVVCVSFSGLRPGVNAAADSILFNGASTQVQVDGASSTAGNRHTFTGTLTITIPSPRDTSFNRYTLVYSSDSHLKGTVYYTENGRSYQEDFFLEPGENTSFSSLTDGYLSNRTGTKISKIELKLINTSKATFALTQINTAVYRVQTDTTVYLENSRFKIGVHLLWGGGLSYLEDKKDGDTSVSNMLNEHDTGRLVQQSYYGTSSAPYQCANYGGNRWPYNPVQGGDQYGNKSKLVDFSIQADSIYVKCRPLDWAQNNQYTLSYMENFYTITEEYISVDNRFIDFSTYNHGSARDQELPAFYTISYLDTFTFYNGSSPWTNGALTVKKDLAFWGGNADAYFRMAQGNTETWCAWTSSEKGYGIGLYTPDITTLLAGRYNYNGSKSAGNDATNYVAPLIQTSMKNCEAFEYRYLITTGTVDSIRTVFKNNKDKAGQNGFPEAKEIDYTNLVFESAEDVQVFTGLNQCSVSFSSPKAAKFTVTATPPCDVQAVIDYSRSTKALYTNQYTILSFTYMVPKTNANSSYKAELFLCTGSRQNAEGGYSVTVDLICDGNYQTAMIDLSKYPNIWPKTAESINKIRFDFFSDASKGDVFYLTEFSLHAGSGAKPTDTPKPATPTQSPTPGITATQTNTPAPTQTQAPTAEQTETATATATPDAATNTETPEATTSPETELPTGSAAPTEPAGETDAVPTTAPEGSTPAPETSPGSANETEAAGSPDTSDTDKSAGGKIGWFIFGAVIVCAGIAVLIVWLLKRRSKDPEAPAGGNGTNNK